MSTTNSTLAVSRDLGLRTGLWQPDLTHSAVLFSIRHLGLAKVRGRFDRFAATLTVDESIAETRVEATIDLASINTNNTDRDAHLRSTDFFSVEAHPEMRFVSTSIEGANEEWTLHGDLTLNATGRVRPFRVRSPRSVHSSSAPSMLVETKRISGWASTEKKSVERRWASRSPLLVLIEARSMIASTLVSAIVSPTVTVASKRSNRPRTLAKPRCRIENSTAEWVRSGCQTPVRRPRSRETAMVELDVDT